MLYVPGCFPEIGERMERKCIRCEAEFQYEVTETWWDYKGTDYDAKLVKCPLCGAINVIKYIEMPNREEWYAT